MLFKIIEIFVCSLTNMKHWRPIESNPEVLTEFARQLGLKDSLNFHDILAFEDWALEMIPQPVAGVLFLYKLNESEQLNEIDNPSMTPPFFLPQTVGNACGTVALIHLLAHLIDNSVDGQVDPNGWVGRFLNDCVKDSYNARAIKFENNIEIETLHRGAERQGQSAEEEDEVDTHFICFVEKDQQVWELDGRKSAPKCWGPCEDFLKKVVDVVKKEFIDKNPGELRFALQALA